MDLTAPRGTELSCRGWRQEAILRMLHNNLENAEDPQELIIYGGTGRAARDHASLATIVEALRALADDETLVVQSGKPIATFRTHEDAPRVLIANANLVPHWSNWDEFRPLERAGLTMYGQMTAGSWCYIGSQGIIQGTYETFAAAGRAHWGDDLLRGRILLTGGLGGMGGAQPLAAVMAGAACLAVEVDPARIERRHAAGFVEQVTDDVDEAVQIVTQARDDGEAVSVALQGNCADVLPALQESGFQPDVVTDQTSAHDALDGYVPGGMAFEDALELRRSDADAYVERSMASMASHCRAIVEFQRRGAVAFDYGNNLRGQARDAGFSDAFAYPGFVKAYIRPMFAAGRGPFRWVALSGDPSDIAVTDELVLEMFPEDETLTNWIHHAREELPVEGLPARVCWLGFGQRHRFAAAINDRVADGTISAPVAITRDHLDTGSVASPYRETEGMADGSDAIADWPLLNALLNTACGADLVAIHNGGGVGIGLSTHAGQITVADGTPEAARRIERVFVADPGIGVARHADAGYGEAVKLAGSTDLFRYWQVGT